MAAMFCPAPKALLAAPAFSPPAAIFADLHWAITLGIALFLFIVLFGLLLWFIKRLILGIVSESVGRFSSSLFGGLFEALKSGAAGDAPGSRAGDAGGSPYNDNAGRIAGRSISRSRERSDLRRRLRELQKSDPNFSEQKFKDLAAATFVKVHEAIEAKDLSPVHVLVSPPFIQRLSLLVSELRDKGRTRHIDNISVKSNEIADARHDGPYYYLTVRIESEEEDYTVDDATGEIVAGSRGVNGHSRRLTFLRSDEVKTEKDKSELVPLKCPNCGAPVDVNASGRCNYCDSVVTGGAFGWALSEISEE